MMKRIKKLPKNVRKIPFHDGNYWTKYLKTFPPESLEEALAVSAYKWFGNANVDEESFHSNFYSMDRSTCGLCVYAKEIEDSDPARCLLTKTGKYYCNHCCDEWFAVVSAQFAGLEPFREKSFILAEKIRKILEERDHDRECTGKRRFI